MSENALKRFKRMIIEIGHSLKARPMFKNNLTPIDNDGNVVAFKTRDGYCNAMAVVDIEDYYSLGSTN